MIPYQEIIKQLSERFGIRIALVFGSLAKNQARPESDLDIAVAAPHPLSTNEKVEFIEALAEASGRPVDLIDLQVARGPIAAQALTTGKLIHCTDRTLYAELILRMLCDQADWAPYRERILAERRKAWIGL